MRRVRFNKVLVLAMLVSISTFLIGCETVTKFDKNKNSYITEPYNKMDSTQTE